MIPIKLSCNLYFCVLLIFFLIVPNKLHSQESLAQEIAQNRPTSCNSASETGIYQSLKIFKEKRNYESLKKIIYNWERSCEPIEILTRIKILYSILFNRFKESIYDDYIVDHLYVYRYVMTHPETYAQIKDKNYKELNQITQQLAQDLLKKHHTTRDIKYLLLLHYSNDFVGFTEQIWHVKYQGSKLQNFFFTYLDKGVNQTLASKFCIGNNLFITK